jgi:ATP-dependent DNA helicase RecQ
MLVAASDLAVRRRLLEGSEGERDEAVVAHKWGLFLELLRWAEGGSCRHDAILRYFGDDAEALHGCGRCDVCLALDEGEGDRPDPETVTLVVRKALSAVARVHNRFGLEAAVHLLQGVDDERLARTGLDRTPTFGTLKEYPPDWILKLLRRCVTAGWADFTASDRPVLLLTDVGRAVMKAERPARLLLPPRSRPRVAGGSRPRRDRAAAPEDALDAGAQRVFEALRHHRLGLARDQGVPPYVIASDRALREMATQRPRTRAELLEVHGIGPAKAERYGAGFLEVIQRESSAPA